MVHLSILDEDFADMTSLQIRLNELEEENKRLKKQIDWYNKMMFDWKYKDEYHAVTRNQRLSEAYRAIYGDTPLCDCCDGKTGFFLTIDYICNAILGSKWLLRIFRWCGYKPYYIHS